MNTKAIFHTTSKIAIEAVAEGNRIIMTYPKYGLQQYDLSAALLQSLGLNEFKTAGLCSELEALFIEMNSAAELRAMQPDYAKLVTSNNEITEVVITSVAELAVTTTCSAPSVPG